MAVSNAKKTWKSLTDDKVSEAEKLAKMFKEEKAEYLRQKEREEFEAEKAAFEKEKNMTKTESVISWMESKANNNNHGYDQKYRWGEKGDYDCSSAVITAWEQAGVPVKTKGATYTGNMYAVFIACGFKDVTASVNRSTGAGLKQGDVLLNKQKHTAMYCGNGLEVEASINEKGGIIGGVPGDQTGREFLI